MKSRADIIGAGPGGLAAAWRLSQLRPDLELHVWDRDTSPGGLAGSFETADFRVEKFYHHIFRRDTAIQALIAEMGLQDALQWRAAATGSYYLRQPYRLSTPLDVLRFSPLGLVDRFRLGWLALHARTVRDWERLDDLSVRAYIVRVAGQRVYEVVWEPLLRGKFGPYADTVSAAWLWRKLVERGGSRNNQGAEYLGYLQGGMGRLFEEVADRLRAAGHHLHLGTSVRRLHADGGRIMALETDTGLIPTDGVIATCQLPDLIPMLPPDRPDYAEQLREIGFLGNVCLVLSLSDSLSRFYWTNITDPEAPFVGVIEQTNWADPAAFNQRRLVYISAYTPPDDPRMGWDAQTLLAAYMPWLKRLFEGFDPATVLDAWVWKSAAAQPVVTCGYRKRVPAHTTPWPNLWLCTMAQIYPSDRQVSNGIGLGYHTAELAAAGLSS
ncbi:MAG: FAD-dependent oxidoreductase [Bacteroidia bacterium]|nr:FAD-dependent oxidoreductase [Bacteroidia bacterium]